MSIAMSTHTSRRALLSFLCFAFISSIFALPERSGSPDNKDGSPKPGGGSETASSSKGSTESGKGSQTASSSGGSAEAAPEDWAKIAQAELNRRLSEKKKKTKAKNIIFLMGDGMSVATVTASRILKGQREGSKGENAQLSFDKFPFTGFSKTYCADKQVPDSASTATAFFTGIKTNSGVLGVSSKVKFGDCKAMNNKENHLTSIFTWAQKAGKATGIVTNTRVTHASPAAAYAHTAHRDWERDSDIIKAKLDPKECEDIASQLMTKSPGKDMKVIMGGGRSAFLPTTKKEEDGAAGLRQDGKDLISTWQSDQKSLGVKFFYATNKDQLKSIPPDTVSLLGLFAASNLPYASELPKTNKPTLAEMTEAAIKVLQKDKEGFLLFVESGRIDHAHHSTEAQRALEETVALSEAVEKALSLVNLKDTLIIVTADHAHTMTISGYPDRGENILGAPEVSGVDKLPYATLSYANGPGYVKPQGPECNRADLSKVQLGKNPENKYPALVPLRQETHGGEDVGIYATGPWAHLFTGTFEQNYIAHGLAYAACIGPYKDKCHS